MPIDETIARALGWPRLKYADLERERRWLCREVPPSLLLQTVRLTDLYVTGTRLRLRQEAPLDGSAPILRLTRKGDIDSATRILTSIYLAPEEFALFCGLPGVRLSKTRHRLNPAPGAVSMGVDVFEGPLRGLMLLEAEFSDDEAMAAFAAPPFAGREVTFDDRYRSAALALDGLPVEP